MSFISAKNLLRLQKVIYMKKVVLIFATLLLIYFPVTLSQSQSDTSVYLLTCGTGLETYSIYGHSALRVYIPEKGIDAVYNWGIFDFDAPNFVWKFAKGRLDYKVGVEPMKSFLREYLYEKRFVYAQKVNLSSRETKKMLALLDENLKPENIKYRYDFFYDDCSTRIRDLFEKCTDGKLLYPPSEKGKIPTFRNLVGKYQAPFPWLNFGVDLIMGSSSDKKALFRDRMFLPLEMQVGLSETVINRSGKMIPLLQNPVYILDFDSLETKHFFIYGPSFVFTLLLIIIIVLSAMIKNKKMIKVLDISVFSVFSILVILIIFFSFFTDHQQMKMNLNILWLNPLIILGLIAIVLNKPFIIWFRILFYISGAFLVLHFILPQDFNLAILPLIIIIMLRSSVRADFDWNPFNSPNLKRES